MPLYFTLDEYIERYITKQLALFHAIRDAIIAGKLLSHERLPATRELAEQYNISRGTVSNVYDMLAAQGYLYTIGGSGTYVYQHSESLEAVNTHTSGVQLSDWGARLYEHTQLTSYLQQPQLAAPLNQNIFIEDRAIDFHLAKVNLKDFPLHNWNKVMYEHTRKQYEYEMLDSYTTDGHPRLKQAIAQHLHQHRGIKVNSEQIVIVNGSQQALTLLIHLLVNKGDRIALENPHYVGIRHAIEAVGGCIDTFPVDRNGVLFSPTNQHYKLVYVTPNRQFPTGSILSMERRRHLLKWAQEKDTFIVEDDYDSEFNYSSRALEPLKALDVIDHVIYIGTFSRTMMQHIRIGYAVLPKRLKEPFTLAKMLFERHPTSIIQQRALATFMESGYYDRHLRRAKRLYKERAEYLMQQINNNLSHLFSFSPIKAGLHLYVSWVGPKELFHPFLEACRKYNVSIINSESMYYHSPIASVCLGFAHLSTEDIKEGVRRLVLAWVDISNTQK